MENVARNIWETSNYINNCLLSVVRKGISDGDGCLLMDSLSHKQGIMLLAVKELNTVNPNGSSLKELARHLGVTEPSASVMVNTLVKKGVLKRLTSDSDRREVKIKLSEKAAEHFTNMDEKIFRQIMCIGDAYGEELLLKWQELLQQLKLALDSLASDE